MIIQHFSDCVAGRIFAHKPGEELIAHLQPLFDRLHLPMIKRDECHQTREGGLLVLLNKYGCALRLFEHDNNKGRLPAKNFHIYHEDVLPHIAHIHLEKFSAIITAGVALYDQPSANNKIEDQLVKDIGHHGDAYASQNLGFIQQSESSKKLCLIDTVVECRMFDKYNSYIENNVERMLDHYKVFAPLQESFHKCWSTDDPQAMQEFWDKCETELQNGTLLKTGWLAKGNEILDSANKQKKGFVEQSIRYDKRAFPSS